MRASLKYVTLWFLALLSNTQADEFAEFRKKIDSIKDVKVLSVKVVETRKEFIDALKDVKKGI